MTLETRAEEMTCFVRSKTALEKIAIKEAQKYRKLQTKIT
jgi:hypothetical protein